MQGFLKLDASVLLAASPPKRGSPGSRAPGTGSPMLGMPNVLQAASG